MTRRVLVLNQFALPRSSAGGTRHVELFSLLEGWDAVLLVGRRNMHDQGPVSDEGILETVAVTPYRGNGVSRVVNWLSYSVTAGLSGLTKGTFDVYYGSSPHLGTGLVALVLARLRRRPFVLEVRDLWPQILADAGMIAPTSAVYRVLAWLERLLYREASAIVVLAQGSAGDIEAHGIDPESILFVPNGADPKDFVVAAARDDLRARFGFAADEVVAVYAGAHGPANGLDLVLDAAAGLADDDPPVRIVLVGDGVSKAELQRSANDRGLGNVTFLDPIPKSEIPELFAASDIGLHCLADVELFRRGVSPNKIYDYMAAGLAVITNTPGEVAELVASAGSGEAVEPTELEHGLRRLAALTHEERRALGRSGQDFMERERSRAAMAARIEALLDSLVR